MHEHSHRAIRAIARQLRDERLDELTTTSLRRLDIEETAYAAMTDDPVMKRAGMRRTLELALSRLAGDDIPENVSRATEDVGRERAEQGFPLPALIHSFQLDLRILWEAVLAEGRARGFSSDPDFVDSLILVWEATEANSVEVVDAYRRTERDLASRRDEVRARAFERLVLDSELDATIVPEASSLLGIPVEARLVAVVAEGVPTGDAVLSRCRDGLRAVALPFHFGWMGDELIGVVNQGRQPLERLLTILRPLGAWRCGICSIEGLEGVPRGIRLARAAIRSDVRPGLRPIETHWVGALMATSDELTSSLARTVLSPLMVMRDKDGLFETLRSYLDLGSIAGVATETYRHRNTVRNRLQTVERVTGLNLSKPRDTALLAMAVDWLRTPAGDRFSHTFD